MKQLIKTLFYAMDTDPQEEEVQALKASKDAVQAAQQRLTYEEFEDLWNAIEGLTHASELDSFTLGFRLGVQLTLEGLKPIAD